MSFLSTGFHGESKSRTTRARLGFMFGLSMLQRSSK